VTVPSSASKMMAVLPPRPRSTWRSRQLYETLRVPSSNHLKNGASLSSSTFENGVFQVTTSRARRAQKPSKSSSASLHRAS
jgi:hypothetical protein